MQPGFSIIVLLVSLLLSCYLWDAEAACCLWGTKTNRNVIATISVNNGGQWGRWGPKHFCPKGYAAGFSLKVQPFQGDGILQDDTTLNGIRLHCSDGSVITSSVGLKGYWTVAKSCRGNDLKAFRLRVSKPQLTGDDTAANNIEFMCGSGVWLRGNGIHWGQYGKWSKSCKRGICGLQTKVEVPQGSGRWDGTGLNDVRFFCCED